MKQFCMKIDLISQGRENVLFLPSNMAAMTSHENALLTLFPNCRIQHKMSLLWRNLNFKAHLGGIFR